MLFQCLGVMFNEETDIVEECTLGCLAGRPIEIFCSNPAAQQLRGALPSDFLGKYYNINVVRGDDDLDLGGGEYVMSQRVRSLHDLR